MSGPATGARKRSRDSGRQRRRRAHPSVGAREHDRLLEAEPLEERGQRRAVARLGEPVLDAAGPARAPRVVAARREEHDRDPGAPEAAHGAEPGDLAAEDDRRHGRRGSARKRAVGAAGRIDGVDVAQAFLDSRRGR